MNFPIDKVEMIIYVDFRKNVYTPKGDVYGVKMNRVFIKIFYIDLLATFEIRTVIRVFVFYETEVGCFTHI